MQKSDLYVTFDDQILEFEKYLSFIDKAKAASDKFRAEVIEKVVNDNQARAMNLASELMMVLVEVEEHIDALETQRTDVESSSATASTNLEELELLLAIEALDDDTFADQAAPYKSEIEDAQTSLSAINDEHESFSSVMARWKIAGVASGALQADAN